MQIQIGLSVCLMAVLLLGTACTPTQRPEGADSPYKRHNDWARFGKPDVGGARANDR